MFKNDVFSEETEETTTKEEGVEEEEEEEFGEELSIQDLEFFIEITELWEKMLREEASLNELTKLGRREVKARARRKRKK